MDPRLAVVKMAIDQSQHKRASELLQTYISENNPSADAFLLASELATNDNQRRQYLDRALTLDPFHPLAPMALDALEQNKPFKWEPDRDYQLNEGSTNGAQARSLSVQEQMALQALEKERAEKRAQRLQREKRRYAATVLTEYTMADLPRRLAAALLDELVVFGYWLGINFGIIGIISLVLLVRLLFGGDVSTELTVDGFLQAMVFIDEIAVITFTLLRLWYPIGHLTRDGQTPGRRAMRIAILKLNGENLTMVDVILRNFVGYTISAIPLGLGWLWSIPDKNNQAWHDKLVNTVVIRY